MTYAEWIAANWPDNKRTLPGDEVIAVAKACGANHMRRNGGQHVLFMPGSLDYIYIWPDVNTVSVLWEDLQTDVDLWATWTPAITQRKGHDDAVMKLERTILAHFEIKEIRLRMPDNICRLPYPAFVTAKDEYGAAMLLETPIMFREEAITAAAEYIRQLATFVSKEPKRV